MEVLIVGVVYAVTFLLTYRIAFTFFYDSEKVQFYDEWTRNGAIFVSLLVGLISPLVLPFLLVAKFATPTTGRDRREERTRLDKEHARLDKEIKQLEADRNQDMDRRIRELAQRDFYLCHYPHTLGITGSTDQEIREKAKPLIEANQEELRSLRELRDSY